MTFVAGAGADGDGDGDCPVCWSVFKRDEICSRCFGLCSCVEDGICLAVAVQCSGRGKDIWRGGVDIWTEAKSTAQHSAAHYHRQSSTPRGAKGCRRSKAEREKKKKRAKREGEKKGKKKGEKKGRRGFLSLAFRWEE